MSVVQNRGALFPRDWLCIACRQARCSSPDQPQSQSTSDSNDIGRSPGGLGNFCATSRERTVRPISIQSSGNEALRPRSPGFLPVAPASNRPSGGASDEHSSFPTGPDRHIGWLSAYRSRTEHLRWRQVFSCLRNANSKVLNRVSRLVPPPRSGAFLRCFPIVSRLTSDSGDSHRQSRKFRSALRLQVWCFNAGKRPEFRITAPKN